MHVQHSEQTARDQLVIGRLPADAAQVTLRVESMPEPAIVNFTTHNAAQIAESLCFGRGEAQQASALLAQRPSSQAVVTPSGQSPPGFAPERVGVVTDSLAQRRSELLLEQDRKQTQMSGGEQKASAAESIQTACGWNGAGAPAQMEQWWNGAPQALRSIQPLAASALRSCGRAACGWRSQCMARVMYVAFQLSIVSCAPPRRSSVLRARQARAPVSEVRTVPRPSVPAGTTRSTQRSMAAVVHRSAVTSALCALQGSLTTCSYRRLHLSFE
jgi:hypothetical protein